MTISVSYDPKELHLRIKENHIILPLHDVTDEAQVSKFYPVFKDNQGWYLFKTRKYLNVSKEVIMTNESIASYKYELSIHNDRRYGNKEEFCDHEHTLYYDFNNNILYKIALKDISMVNETFRIFRGCSPMQTLGTLYEDAHGLVCFVGNTNSVDFDYFKIENAIKHDKNINC